ncbi:MAG: DUF348 domain-containing protein [Bacillaceae bacterium]|nr:DUF348 domain-containing protein [Bacillaceae bacterium]
MWSGEIKKIHVFLAAGILVVLVSMIAGYYSLNKEITFVHNGEVIKTSTLKTTVGQFLASRDLDYTEHDRIVPGPDEKIREGMTIRFVKKRPVTLYDGPEKRTIYTAGITVSEVLDEQGITLNDEDRIEPGLKEKVADEIRITRITREILQVEEPIVHRVVKKADYTLASGQQETIQKGKNGLARYQYEITYENGREVNRKLIRANIIEDKTDHIVAVGQLGTVSRGGKTFRPLKVLTMELTAYGPGVEHTGKTPDHPEYGITRTGTRATENRTIAVDPNVIPLGWWVYIEGFGYRKAEDTGSAVKGNRIDIYYDDDEFANQFGLKKGYKVYVIGPEKP